MAEKETDVQHITPLVPAEPQRPLLRGVLHLVGFVVALVVGALLVLRSDGTKHVLAAAVFAASVVVIVRGALTPSPVATRAIASYLPRCMKSWSLTLDPNSRVIWRASSAPVFNDAVV